MRKIFKRLFLPVVLAAIYLAGLTLGIYAICASPFMRQKEYFGEHARIIAEEYLEGVEDEIKYITGPNMRILIYDAEGNCLRHVAPSNSNPGSEPGFSLEKYTFSVLAGKEVFTLTLAKETQRELNDIMIVVGVPIMENDSIIGAVFLVKNLMDLPEAVVGYACCFTVFFCLTSYFVISGIRKERKLEELRQNYIGNVTHALKTPVASIKALAETLCDGVEPDSDKQRIYSGMILREANRQDHMIRDILELSKMQSKGMDFTKTSISVAAVLEPVLDKYATLCDYMGISLHISEEIQRLPPLYTNAVCIRHLLEILLDNAIKFVNEGGDIWVDATLSGNQAVVCVRDNGIGIEKEALPHVFERFFKCGHDLNDSGSGLGLAIAKEIISGLKEKIWAESEPCKGAAFFFTLKI